MVIDQSHVLATLHEGLKLSLELLLLDRQVGVLTFMLLSIVVEQHEGMNLLLMLQPRLLVIRVRWPLNLAAIFVRDLELTYALMLFFVDFLKLVVPLLIRNDGHEE